MHHILLLCVVVININSCVSCPVPSDFLLFVFLSGRRPALLASLYLVPSRKRRVATHVCRFALCICTLNRSLNLSCCICIPLAPSCKYTCRAHFLLSRLSMASSRGKRVPHSTTTTLLNSAGARGQHRCNTRLGGWTQINIKERFRVLSCASQSVTFLTAITCCGSRKNTHAYVSVQKPWICQRMVHRRDSTPLK